MRTDRSPEEAAGSGGEAGAIDGRVRRTLSAPRFGKFVSVGVLGAICDNTVLLLTAELGIAGSIAALTGFPAAGPEVAKALGIETAVVVMFLANDRWTFARWGTAGVRPWIRRLATSNAVRLGGITVQLVVFSLVYRLFYVDLWPGGIDLWLLVASGCGIVAGMIVNYFAESLLTWRVHETR